MKFIACFLFMFSLVATDLSDKIDRYQMLVAKKKALSAEKKALETEILSALEKEMNPKIKALAKNQLMIHTTVKEARTFNAIKTIEVIDRAKLKKLYLSGVPVPGITEKPILNLRN